MADENSFLRALRGERPDKLRKIPPEAEFWRDKYIALHSELDQLKTRLERSAEQQIDQEKHTLLHAMLPVADNLERALRHADTNDSAGLRQGIELTLKAFSQALSQQGVEVINAVGQPFDPALHEAAGLRPSSTVPAGTVIEVEQQGYKVNGKVLRPARVIVAGA
ncbi:MAG: nucleotide exchange factor GrpE [Anaerolineae bacterium]|nr:nucleotide exchange factor GrpE [Anaerolineae bacterium]